MPNYEPKDVPVSEYVHELINRIKHIHGTVQKCQREIKESEVDNAEEEELKDLTAETIGNDHHLDWYHGEKEMTSRMLTDIFQASIKDVTKIQNLFFKL